MWIDSHWGNFEKKINTPTENIIQETCDKQKEAFQNSLESALKNGIEIIDNDWFERLKTMLEKHKKINLANITFQELNWGNWVFIKKELGNNSSLWVYNMNNPKIYGTNLVKLWIIENSEFDSYNWLYKLIIAPRENREKEVDYSIPQEPAMCENKVEKSWTSTVPSVEKVPQIQSLKYKEHTIQKWDSLWKLIEANYDLSWSENPNRDIANIALRLGKLKQNKWVIKDWTIFLWKTLFLPNEISTIRIPKEEKKFKLKSEAN